MKASVLGKFTAALGLATCLAAGSSASAQSVDSTLSSMAMFGINKDTAMLYRYGFAAGELKEVGVIRDAAGAPMAGIAAAGYFPGHQQVFAMWRAADTRNKLVYVDVLNASAAVVHEDLEGGRFTGATTVMNVTTPFGLFGVQQAKVKPPSTINGAININPNNSAANEFVMRNGESFILTRDDLHAKMDVAADGTIYKGHATYVHVKPKGNGGQTGLMINGVAYDLRNSNTYSFNGDMEVRIYNDKPTGGKAMGKWWIQIYSGQVYINNEVQVLSPHRLSQVDQKTGVVTELVRLSRAYNGLASLDGSTFFTAEGGSIYRIDAVLGTETKVATTALTGISDLEFAGTYLIAYDNERTAIVPLREDDGSLLGSPLNLGMGIVGPIMFTPLGKDPTLLERTFD